jgi:hypothetical protein
MATTIANQRQADTISLVSESAESCLRSLSGLWSELGLGENERNQACQTLVHNMRKVFEDTIKDAQETKAQVIVNKSTSARSWPEYMCAYAQLQLSNSLCLSNFPIFGVHVKSSACHV